MGVLVRAILAAAIVAVSSVSAIADDWVAVRLRGVVLQLVDGEWAPLRRGDVVPDSRVIRTLRNGNVEFERGEESVALAPDTQIQIYDKVRAKPFTTVKQYFGTVTVEAEVRDVQHFAVQTHYLAAVVKGTKFTVTARSDGARVKVERGSVFVEDKATKSNVTVDAGQTAAVDESGGKPSVSGRATTPDANSRSARSDDPKGPKGKPDDEPGKPGKPDKDDKSNNGKSDDDSGKGKSDDKPGKSDDDDDHPGKGKSGDDGDNSGKGKSGDDGDNSGKGKSGDDGDNPGKGKSGDDGDNPGKGKNGDGKPDQAKSDDDD